MKNDHLDNRCVKDKEYSEKKISYSNSAISITKSIPVNYPEWSIAVIEKRTIDLLEIIYKYVKDVLLF